MTMCRGYAEQRGSVLCCNVTAKVQALCTHRGTVQARGKVTEVRFLVEFRPDMQPAPPPTHWVFVLFPRIQRPEREADYAIL
jgi:hypothetical protein